MFRNFITAIFTALALITVFVAAPAAAQQQGGLKAADNAPIADDNPAIAITREFTGNVTLKVSGTVTITGKNLSVHSTEGVQHVAEKPSIRRFFGNGVIKVSAEKGTVFQHADTTFLKVSVDIDAMPLPSLNQLSTAADRCNRATRAARIAGRRGNC